MVQFSPSYRTLILFAIPLQNALARSISGPDYAAALDSTGSGPGAKQKDYVPPATFAIVHGQLGEKDQAFEWLGESLRRARCRFYVSCFILVQEEQKYAPLRDDPRFPGKLRPCGSRIMFDPAPGGLKLTKQL